jgi:SPP1 gp7 family putative phage head morphogenesis protein
VSAEEQQRIIDEAEQQSAEIARLQEESGNKLEAILTAALLAVLPSILRAYRSYTSVLTGEDGVQLPRGTGAWAASRRRALQREIEGFTADVDLDAINATVREVLTEAATIGSTAAQVLGTVQDIAIDATPLMGLEARAAAIVGRISAELQGFQSIMSQVVFDSAVQGFPGRRLERVIIEAFQGEQLRDGTVRSRGLIQRAAFTIETEVSIVSLDQQMQAIRAAGQQYVRWVTAQDEKVCPFCASRHGRIYLSDRITIPAHMRCRCMAVPVPMPTPDAAPDDGFWQEEYARTVAAYAAANNLSVEDAAARLRTYRDRPTQAEKLRYPGIDDAPPPIWQPPA